MKYIKLLFVVVSLLAIVYIGYDYTCGHMNENLFNHEYCQICDSYGTAGIVSVFCVLYLFLFMVQLFVITFKNERPHFSSFIDTVFSLRAPPAFS